MICQEIYFFFSITAMNSLKKYGFLRKSFALSKSIIFNILFQIISTKLGFSHLSASPFIFEVFYVRQ